VNSPTAAGAAREPILVAPPATRIRNRSPTARCSGSAGTGSSGRTRPSHALVAYAADDPLPVAIARRVDDGYSAEVAFAVVDAYQRLGIGSALTTELLADARAAGITALIASDNDAAVALLRRVLSVLEIRFGVTELSIRAAIG
jgi:ribosomal protein S18 acetylase RimI-like enzyme